MAGYLHDHHIHWNISSLDNKKNSTKYKKYQQKDTYTTNTTKQTTLTDEYVAFLNTAHGIPVNKRETLWNTVDNRCEL